MFIKVLLTDDELLARNHLRSLIDWEKHGYTICGEAEDGIKSIGLIEKIQPHIILIDIDMPLMDGVSLCRYIREHHKEIQTIILSNFDNYDYVRETLSCNAVDYLLKHRLSPELLLDVLDKACARFDERPDQTGTGYVWNPQAITGLLLQRKTPLTASEASALKWYTKNTVVLAMQILYDSILTERQSSEEHNMFLHSIGDFCQQLIGDTRKGCVAFVEHGRFVFILSYAEYRSEMAIIHSLQVFMEKVERTLRLIYNITVVFGQSPVCNQIEKLHSHYIHACNALDRKLHWTDDPSPKPATPAHEISPITLTIQQEKEIMSAIVIYNIPQIEAIIDEVFDAFTLHSSGYRQLVFLIEDLINLAHRLGKKCGADVRWISEDMSRERSNMGNQREIKKWVKKTYRRLVEDINRTQNNAKYSKYVEGTINYIHKHYSERVSLEEAADHLRISPSYLSRLFKEETGISFTEYSNQFKIELSKQSIESGNQKIKDLYHRFGFTSYSYFFKVFKDIVGETPQAYAKKFAARKSERQDNH